MYMMRGISVASADFADEVGDERDQQTQTNRQTTLLRLSQIDPLEIPVESSK